MGVNDGVYDGMMDEDGLNDGWLVVDIVDIDGCAVDDIEDGDGDDEGGEDLVIVGKDVNSLFMPSPPTTALELSSSLIINSSTSSFNSFVSSNIPSIALLSVVVSVLLLLVWAYVPLRVTSIIIIIMTMC